MPKTLPTASNDVLLYYSKKCCAASLLVHNIHHQHHVLQVQDYVNDKLNFIGPVPELVMRF